MLGNWWESGRRLWIGKWIIDLGALPALGRVGGGQCGALGLGIDGTGQRGSVPTGRCGGLWLSYERVLKSAAVMGRVRVLFVCCLLSAVCCLLSAVCCLLSAVCCLLSAEDL